MYRSEAERLLAFGQRSLREDGGAAWLSVEGKPLDNLGEHTYLAARMAHSFGLGALLDIPDAQRYCREFVVGLDRLRDREYGGWLENSHSSAKSCYDHAFVLLAASTAKLAGIAEAAPLLDEATDVFATRFFDEEANLCVDAWDQSWTTLEDYRGLNGNMHAVEAMFAAADATGDADWDRRAFAICDWVANLAVTHHHSLPEHFDADMNPLLEFNANRRDDQFKPYGATIGHGLEWSRLFAQAAARLPEGEPQASRYQVTAVGLFEHSVADGWAIDGADGFVYTIDWSQRPVVRDRMHWVVTEALAAAAVLSTLQPPPAYTADGQWLQRWWEYAEQHLIDRGNGSWHHQLSADNRPIQTVWIGKPDIYHALQACLFLDLVPQGLPVGPSLASALAQRG